MTGISHERLQTQGAIQWACPDNTELESSTQNLKSKTQKSKRLYTNHRFPTLDSRACFAAHHSRGLAEPPDPEYPFVLTNGRLYGHWHTQTRTGRIEKIKLMHPRPFIEIHPRDADKLGIQDDNWVEVRSSWQSPFSG